MKKVTLWFYTNKTGDIEYNHLEDGHSVNDMPTPNPAYSSQLSWKGKRWIKQHKIMSNNKIVPMESESIRV